MKIVCTTCGKNYDIPDERLPDKKKFSFPCPACKGIISVDLTPPEPEALQKPAPARELPKGEALKQQVLNKIKTLPAMPQTVMKARQVMSSGTAGFKDLAEVLETDQAIAGKLLKLSNSSYYGMRGKVSSLQHASVVLGMTTLKEIILLAGSSSLLANRLDGYGLEPGDLWQHSLGVAFGAKFIAARKSPALKDDAFTAGLLHDCGKLVLDEPILERKPQFVSVTETAGESFLKAEKTILGFDHPEIAYTLCKSWSIPDGIINAIRYHHSPKRSQGDRLTHIVHAADTFAMMSGLGAGIDGMAYETDEETMTLLNIREEEIPEILEEIIDSVTKITEANASA